MNIKVLSYIDTESLNNTANVSGTDNPNESTTAASSEARFSEVFDTAKKATAAVMIDKLVKESENGSVDCAVVQRFFDQYGINIQVATNETVVDAIQPVSSDPMDTTVSSEAYDTSDAAATGTSTSNTTSASQSGEGLECSAELDAIFDEAAEKYGVDAKFLKSIAKCESDFDPACVSHSGATGIMQLMPATAAELGVSDSYDPYQNIMGGAQYISELLDKYNGDTSLALAAYNAGSGNVAKYGGIPPFTETQNYVNKVLGYYNS